MKENEKEDEDDEKKEDKAKVDCKMCFDLWSKKVRETRNWIKSIQSTIDHRQPTFFSYHSASDSIVILPNTLSYKMSKVW